MVPEILKRAQFIEGANSGRGGSGDSDGIHDQDDDENAGDDQASDGQAFLSVFLYHANDGENQAQRAEDPANDRTCDGNPEEAETNQGADEAGGADAILLKLNGSVSVFFHNETVFNDAYSDAFSASRFFMPQK